MDRSLRELLLVEVKYLQVVQRQYFFCHQHFYKQYYYEKRNGAFLLKCGAVPTSNLPSGSDMLCQSDVNINLPAEESV